MNFPPREAGSGKRFRWIGGNFMVGARGGHKGHLFAWDGIGKDFATGDGRSLCIGG